MCCIFVQNLVFTKLAVLEAGTARTLRRRHVIHVHCVPIWIQTVWQDSKVVKKHVFMLMCWTISFLLGLCETVSGKTVTPDL